MEKVNDSIVPKILVVDDKPENLFSMETILSDFSVITASNGKEALKLSLENEYAIILLDVQMPEMDGFEVAEILRSTRKTQVIPIIFITALNSDEQFTFKGYDAGAVDYLYKPINPDILRSKIRIFCELYTQRKKLEKQMVDLELSAARHRKAEQLIAVNILAGGVAHRFNNLFAGIIGYADMIKMKSEEGDGRVPTKYIDGLIDSSIKAKEIVGQMTKFANIKVDDKTPELLNLNDLVLNAVKLLEEELNVDGVEVRLNLRSTQETLADRFDINEVLLAFIVNAKHAMLETEDACLVVETIDDGEMVLLSVTDNGCGIKAEDIDKLFLPFYTKKGEFADKETAQCEVRGNGLGLSFSHTIITDSGGTIEVESEEGVGSTFTLRLPVNK